MKNLRTLPLCVLASALFCAASLTAQQFAPTVRIVNRIDETNLVTLKGNTNPHANSRNDLGRVSPNLPMTDLILVLSRDPAQQAAFEKFVDGQYDSNSPDFHQWLTPDQVGENFGPSQTDIATITNWLTGHGFSVTQETKDHMSIRFSGTAAQVESAFHTEIHNLSVKGVSHIGNMSDPQIPAALAPVVVGVKSLHNFFPKPLHRAGSKVTRDSATGKWQRAATIQATAAAARALIAAPAENSTVRPPTKVPPQFGISVGGTEPYLVEDMAPYDFATIYNVLPLWTASKAIDGSGQTIAIAGTSSVVPNDVATFRSFFLPGYTSTPAPILMSGNSEPATVCTDQTGTVPYPTNPCDIDDLLENSLDVEWSGAIAPKAQIVLVSSYPASASDDNLYDSESYIVNNVTARIMNVSYGECELGQGTAGNVEYYNLWQTAASEGIAVFVAAGDSGSASCDDGGDEGGDNLPYPAEYGLSVSGLASTPYNTAVGGTDFNWCSLVTASNTECTASPYWSSSNSANASAPESNALGYVPEVPWNDTCTSPLATAWMEQFWQGYDYKNSSNANVSVTDAETGCNIFGYYAQELSQDGDGGLLYLVDTIGGSGGASGCVVNDGADVSSCTSSTTSTGSSYGSIPLVNDGWPKPSWQTNSNIPGLPTDGVRDIPDVSFFASDGFLSSSAYLVCVSELSACSYSEKTEPVFLEVGGTSVATPAMAGVMALVNEKTGAAQGSPNAELYKLAASQTYASCSAERGNGAPVTSSACMFNDIDTGTNAMACDYDAYVTTPSPNCTLKHTGDYFGILTGYSAGAGYDEATGLGSLNVANVVNAWPAVQGSASATVTVLPAQTSINSSNSLSVTVTVASKASGGVTPTGTITLTASGSTYSGTGSLSSAGSYTFAIPANSLGAGVDTLTASYSGDVLYAAAANTAQVTVTTLTLLTPTVNIKPASTTLNSNASLGVAVSVAGNGVITPTGTVTLTTGSYSSGAQTLVSGSYNFTIPANTLTSGSNSIKVTYNGDGNYQSASNTTTVTVTTSTFTLTTPTITVSPATVAPGASSTATVTVAAVAGYTGAVTLTCQETSNTASGGDGANCSPVGTASVTLTSGTTSGTAQFTVTTTASSTTTAGLVYPKVRGQGRGWMGAGGGAVLAFLVFLGIPARRRSWRQMLGVLVLMAALAGLSSCGSGGSGTGTTTQTDPGTTAGVYTFTVQSTGNPTVTPGVSTTFQVTVN